MRMGHPTVVPANYDPETGERTDLDEGDGCIGHGTGAWMELNSNANELFPLEKSVTGE